MQKKEIYPKAKPLALLGADLVEALCVQVVLHLVSIHRRDVVRICPCHADYYVWVFPFGLQLAHRGGIGCVFEYHVTGAQGSQPDLFVVRGGDPFT